MVIDSTYKQAVKAALASAMPFALFFRKGSDTPEFFAGVAPMHSRGREFVAVGWLGLFANRVRIPFCGNPASVNIDCDVQSELQAMPSALVSETVGYYTRSLEALIGELRRTGGKTVISRAIRVENPDIDILEVAERYFSASPDSYRCLFNTPDTGCWLIASPELLMKTDACGRFSTMSLAGTRVYEGDDRMSRPWDAKNLHEQALVTRFIADTLREAGADVVIGPVHTQHAARVEHICTLISGTLASGCYGGILDNLSPTPALCGSPRNLSIKRISRIERHQREMYGGYFGVDYGDGALELAVNLRSARLYADGACLFAGGGITADSVPSDEWQETQNKSALLLKFLTESSR